MHNPKYKFFTKTLFILLLYTNESIRSSSSAVQLEASSNEVKGGQRTKKSFVFCLSMHAAPCIIGWLAGWLGLPWRGILSEIVKRCSNKVPP